VDLSGRTILLPLPRERAGVRGIAVSPDFHGFRSPEASDRVELFVVVVGPLRGHKVTKSAAELGLHTGEVQGISPKSTTRRPPLPGPPPEEARGTRQRALRLRARPTFPRASGVLPPFASPLARGRSAAACPPEFWRIPGACPSVEPHRYLTEAASRPCCRGLKSISLGQHPPVVVNIGALAQVLEIGYRACKAAEA